MHILKFAYILFVGGFLTIHAAGKEPPFIPEDSSRPRYNCVHDRYRDFNSFSIADCQKDVRKRWLLSLDGGGVRALLHLMTLEKLEDITNTSITKLFDGISGTSSGGVLAFLLTMRDPKNELLPMYSPKKLLGIMMARRNEMFVKRWMSLRGLLGPRYKIRPLERYFGSLLVNDNFKSRLLPVVVAAHDLNSYSERILSTIDGPDFSTAKVATAISAVPTYFAPQLLESTNSSAKYLLIDGGTVMDNPVLAGVSLLQQHYGASLKNVNVLSLGTGIDSETHSNDSLLHGGLISWAGEVVNLCRTGQLSAIDSIARSFLGDRYNRMQPVLGKGNLQLADVSYDYIYLLEKAHKQMLTDNALKLNYLACSLLESAAERKPVILKPQLPMASQQIAKRSFSTTALGRQSFITGNLPWIRRFCLRR